MLSHFRVDIGNCVTLHASRISKIAKMIQSQILRSWWDCTTMRMI